MFRRDRLDERTHLTKMSRYLSGENLEMNDASNIGGETSDGSAKDLQSRGEDARDTIALLEEQLAYERETKRRLTEILSSFEVEREDILSIRDYAIGTEQELGQARFELQQHEKHADALRTEIVETHAHLAASIADSQAAHRQLANTPSRRLRRKLGHLARRAGLR